MRQDDALMAVAVLLALTAALYALWASVAYAPL